MKKWLTHNQSEELKALGYHGGSQIGDLIELLTIEDKHLRLEKVHPGFNWQWFVSEEDKDLTPGTAQEQHYELCDILFLACKEVLSRKA